MKKILHHQNITYKHKIQYKLRITNLKQPKLKYPHHIILNHINHEYSRNTLTFFTLKYRIQVITLSDD